MEKVIYALIEKKIIKVANEEEVRKIYNLALKYDLEIEKLSYDGNTFITLKK